MICLCALPVAALSQVQPPAFVRGNEDGQGFLMTRLGACFLVTAAHVLAGGRSASLAGASSPVVLGSGMLLASDEAQDVAVMEVKGALAELCGVDFIRGASDDSINRQSAAVLSHVFEDGSVGREDFTVVDVGPTHIRIRRSDAGKSPMQRLSGSIVSVADRPAGMFLSVDPRNGDGRLLRYDELMATVRRLLETRPPSSPVQAASASGRGDSRNLADARAGAHVLAWSTAPVKPELDALNLLKGSGSDFWESQLSQGPVTVDVELAGGQITTISDVELEQGGAPAEVLVKDYEVLVSADGLSWPLVGGGAFVEGQSISVLTFPPRRARFIRLRLLSSFDRQGKRVAVSRLIVR